MAKSTQSTLKPYSTKEVASLSGLAASTLRNYVWLSNIDPDARALNDIQKAPLNFPAVKLVRQRLQWPRAQTDHWLANRVV